MKTWGTPAICLGPTGNLQGTYNFLNLVTGLVIKCHRFNELPALNSVIAGVTSLAGKNGVSSNLVFANCHRIPYDWPDNTETTTGLDPTPITAYPDIPSKMPGVILEHHLLTSPDPPALPRG